MLHTTALGILSSNALIKTPGTQAASDIITGGADLPGSTRKIVCKLQADGLLIKPSKSYAAENAVKYMYKF